MSQNWPSCESVAATKIDFPSRTIRRIKPSRFDLVQITNQDGQRSFESDAPLCIQGYGFLCGLCGESELFDSRHVSQK
jgi:hypothetical protein